MEQKKTLWIALSTGFFLLAVFGTALIAYSDTIKKDNSAIALKDSNDLWIAPQTDASFGSSSLAYTGADSSSPSGTQGIDASSEGMTSSDNDFESIAGTYQPAAGNTADAVLSTSDPVTIIANGQTNIYSNAVTAQQGTTINVNDNATVDSSSSPHLAASVIPQNAGSEKTIKETQNTRKIEESASQKPAAVAASPKKTSETSGASKPASTSTGTSSKKIPATSSSDNVDRWWVQVAAYSTKKTADEARTVLDRAQIPCEVFTVDKNGTLLYRVRAGSYPTKNEAEYWKKKIDTIDMFKTANSLVINSKKS